MLICKIFSGTDSFKVEEEINSFFKQYRQITIHSINQSSDHERIFISIYFNVKSRVALKEEKAIEQIETIVSKAELSN